MAFALVRSGSRVQRRWRAGATAGLVLLGSLGGCGSDRVTLPRSGVPVDGTRIAVTDNCHDDPRLDIEESASRVEFTFTVAAETGGDCFSCTVENLDQPVGERAVVDASTGEAVPTTGDCFEESG